MVLLASVLPGPMTPEHSSPTEARKRPVFCQKNNNVHCEEAPADAFMAESDDDAVLKMPANNEEEPQTKY